MLSVSTKSDRADTCLVDFFFDFLNFFIMVLFDATKPSFLCPSGDMASWGWLCRFAARLLISSEVAWSSTANVTNFFAALRVTRLAGSSMSISWVGSLVISVSSSSSDASISTSLDWTKSVKENGLDKESTIVADVVVSSDERAGGSVKYLIAPLLNKNMTMNIYFQLLNTSFCE